MYIDQELNLNGPHMEPFVPSEMFVSDKDSPTTQVALSTVAKSVYLMCAMHVFQTKRSFYSCPPPNACYRLHIS